MQKSPTTTQSLTVLSGEKFFRFQVVQEYEENLLELLKFSKETLGAYSHSGNPRELTLPFENLEEFLVKAFMLDLI